MTAEAKELKRTLFRDGFNYFLSKIIPGLMGFLSVLVFVRLLGVEQYGRYAVIFAFVMAWASGLSGWLSQGMLRFQSQWHEPEDTASFLRSTILGTGISATAGFIFLGIAMPALGIEKGWSLVIPLTLLGALIVYIVATARFQASLQSRKVLWLEATRAVLCFLIPVSLLVLTRTRDYRLLLLGIAIGYSLPLAGWILLRERPGRHHAMRLLDGPSARARKVLGEIWRFGWPVAVWLLCQQGLLVSDRYFLQRFSGYADAGVYASMYDLIVRSFSLIFMPVTLAIHPLVMKLWNSGKRGEAVRAIRSGVIYQLLLFIPVGIGFYFLAPFVTRLVLGSQNAAGSALVLPLAVGGFLWQVCLLSHKPLEILCQTKRMLVGIACSLAINVSGNWLLVPRYGYRAAAYLTIASALAYLLMLSILTPLEELRESAAANPSVVPGRVPCDSVEPVMPLPS
jgi:O-antigen/teichoic acid export membrane protein